MRRREPPLRTVGGDTAANGEVSGGRTSSGGSAVRGGQWRRSGSGSGGGGGGGGNRHGKSKNKGGNARRMDAAKRRQGCSEEVGRRKRRYVHQVGRIASDTLYPAGDKENYNCTANIHVRGSCMFVGHDDIIETLQDYEVQSLLLMYAGLPRPRPWCEGAVHLKIRGEQAKEIGARLQFSNILRVLVLFSR